MKNVTISGGQVSLFAKCNLFSNFISFKVCHKFVRRCFLMFPDLGSTDKCQSSLYSSHYEMWKLPVMAGNLAT